MVLVHSSCPRQTGAGREKGEPTPEKGRLYIDRALRCCCKLLRSPSLRPFRHPHTCSELALFSSSSQFKFRASFFFSSSSFALLQLLPPLRLLQLEVDIHSPHLFLINDAHEFFSSTASGALISLCTPPSHSVCVCLSLFILFVCTPPSHCVCVCVSLSSFSLCRPLSVHSLCVFLFFCFFLACFAQIITSFCKIELQ